MRDYKLYPLTETEKEKRRISRQNRPAQLQEVLAQIITDDWKTYSDIHRQLNIAMRKLTNNKYYDIEFISLGEVLQKVSGLEWHIEKTGTYPNQREVYLRLPN